MFIKMRDNELGGLTPFSVRDGFEGLNGHMGYKLSGYMGNTFVNTVSLFLYSF